MMGSQQQPTLSNCYIPLSVSSLPPSTSSSSYNESINKNSNDKEIFMNRLRCGQRDTNGNNNKNSQSTTTTTTSATTINTRTSTENHDDRAHHTLRQIHLETNIMNQDNDTNDSNLNADSNANGTSLVEIGLTKVSCHVIGPVTNNDIRVPNTIQSQFSNDHGFLYVNVQYIPISGYPMNTIALNAISNNVNNAEITNQSSTNTNTTTIRNINQMISMKENDISKRIITSLTSCIPIHTKQYSKNVIMIYITIIQDDGSILPSCILASSLALINASIEIYDCITSCTVAIILDTNNDNNDGDKDNKKQKGHKCYYLVDPTLYEMDMADSIITIGMMPSWKEITCWEQTSQYQNHSSVYLTPDMINVGIELCYDGCRIIHRFIKEHFLNKTTKPK